MVICMTYCGAAVIEAFGQRDARESVAHGEHLTTLAFSESGSRSHFWAPLSTAVSVNGAVRLDAKKLRQLQRDMLIHTSGRADQCR